MMGALAFMVKGSMCCAVSRTTLLVRVGAEGHERAFAEPHVEPMVIGARTMSGFVRVEPEGFLTEAALSRWIERGIKVGAVAKQLRDRAS